MAPTGCWPSTPWSRWIDEVLIDAPWDGRSWWKENALEVEIFNTRLRNEQFYLKASEASSLPQKDALETFYVCVVLGFRGLYRDPVAAAALAEPRQLPPDLETWARQTSMAIQLGQGRPAISEASEPLEGAPPLDGPFLLIWSSLCGVILAVFVVIFAWLFVLPSELIEWRYARDPEFRGPQTMADFIRRLLDIVTYPLRALLYAPAG